MTPSVPPSCATAKQRPHQEAIMKSVAGAEYLYIRKGTFYFRYKLPKSFLKKDIRISLNTQDLNHALVLIKYLTPTVNNLISLPLYHKMSDKLQKEQVINAIKLDMKRRLEQHHIDQILASEEVLFKDNLNITNALSRVHLTSDTLSDPSISTIGAETRQIFFDLCQKYENLSDMIQNEPIESDPELLILVSYVSKLLLLMNKRSLKEVHTDKNIDVEVRHMAHMMHLFNGGELEVDSLDKGSFNHNNDDETYYGGAAIERNNNIFKINHLADKYGFEIPLSAINYKIFNEKLISSELLLKELADAVFSKDTIKVREIEGLIKSNLISNPVILPEPELTQNKEIKPFSSVYQEFLNFKIEKENLSDKMQKDYERCHTVWQLLTEDADIASYEAKDIGIFIDQCFDLPKMNVAPFNKMTMSERVAADVPEDKRIAPKSVQGYYKWLQSVFAYAKRDTISYIKQSPCTIKRDFTQNKRGPFTDTELNLFQEFALKETTSWKKWSLLLAIYTGARRGELFQLRAEDIKRDQDSGLHYILITDEHESQKVKTDNARRRIPVHSKLIEYGFLDVVSSTTGRILSGIDNRNTITSWFGRLMSQLDIDSKTELNHIRSFHSFRHSFITKIRNESRENLDLYILQQIVGHELSNGGITDSYSHQAASIIKLGRVVEELVIQ